MFNEIMECFTEEKKRKSENWLYDNHVPTAGTYVLLNLDENFAVIDIISVGKADKKTGMLMNLTSNYFNLVKFLDKNSKLITMNKCLDTGKQIHSNNLFSFFVKKESIREKKLTENNINGYYDVLANPNIKYTKPKAKLIYKKTTEQLGETNTELIYKIRNWVLNNLENFIENNNLDMDKKDYLKIFFVYSDESKTKEEVLKEGKRYVLPNIFNSNDYNMELNGEIFGLHSNNMGLNAKKPYLENKSRRIKIPTAVSMDTAINQYYLMEYLSSQAALGNYNIWLDFDEKRLQCLKDRDKIFDIESGLYFRIRQGKTEIEISYLEPIVGYKSDLKDKFVVSEIFELSDNWRNTVSKIYGTKTKVYEIEEVVDEGLFSKWLVNNYTTNPSDFPKTMPNIVKEQLMLSRKQFWNWFKNCNSGHVLTVLNSVCINFIKYAIENNYYEKGKHQFNIWIAVNDYLNKNRRMEETMSKIRESLKNKVLDNKEEWEFLDDEEYFYGVGQIARYMLDLSKKSKQDKKLDMLRPLYTVDSNELVKERLLNIAKKYDYAISSTYPRMDEFLAKILQYKTNNKANHILIMAGFLDKNLFWTKQQDKNEDSSEKTDTKAAD